MSTYTGRQIAIFTDLHGLYTPTKAILEDIQSKGITEIYDLGDDIGIGPSPVQVMDALKKAGVKRISGNSEEYINLGFEPFPYMARRYDDKLNYDWTREQLSEEQLREVATTPHSYELLVGGKKIGLCHFASDVRIDFRRHSVHLYLDNLRNPEISNPSEQFLYTNSLSQQEEINNNIQNPNLSTPAYESVKRDPLFGGKTVSDFDEIIQGHVHFRKMSSDGTTTFRTIRAASLAFSDDDLEDEAVYIIIKEKVVGYDVEEVKVKYSREELKQEVLSSKLPYSHKIVMYSSKKR